MNNPQPPTLEPMSAHEANRFDAWFREGDSVFTGVSTVGSRSPTMNWKTVWQGEVVAVVKITVIKNIGYLNIATRTDMRRRGIGSNTIAILLQQAHVKQLRELRSRVSHSNTAAQRTLAKNGFSKLGFSDEGLVEYRHRMLLS